MNNAIIEISEMSLTDFDEIKNVLTSDFDDFWNSETLKNELCNNNSHYIVAKINNNIVGFAGIKIILDEADIMNIVTKKDSRNSGIGSTLFSSVIDFAKSKNVKKITLEVNENNLSAIHLYEKFGFVRIAERKKYYNGTDTAIIMQLNLI